MDTSGDTNKANWPAVFKQQTKKVILDHLYAYQHFNADSALII